MNYALSDNAAAAALPLWRRILSPIGCLLIIYAVGFVGVLTPYAQDFMRLTPFNLITSLAFIVWGEAEKSARIWWALLIAGVAGWAVEAVGVHTGALFGEYKYGATLGWGIIEIPLLMAVNWAMLIYCVVAMLHFFVFTWQSGFCRRMMTAIMGATLMVALDVLIEPAAVRYDMWQWSSEPLGGIFVAPLRNYLVWWVVSFLILFAVQPLMLHVRNSSAVVLYGLQVLFFTVLYLR